MTGIYPLAGGQKDYTAHQSGAQVAAAPFGPWTTNISHEERIARLRSLRMASLLLYRRHVDFIDALALAETDDKWLMHARVELDRMPSLHRRRLLASYLNLWVRP